MLLLSVNRPIDQEIIFCFVNYSPKKLNGNFYYPFIKTANCEAESSHQTFGYHVSYLVIIIHKALSHSAASVKATHCSAPDQGAGHLTSMAISFICYTKLSDMTTDLVYILFGIS